MKDNKIFEEILTDIDPDDEVDFLPIFSLEESGEADEREEFPGEMPILALRNTVLFPHVVIPITVGREKSNRAIQRAYEGNRIIGVISQREKDTQDPTTDDLYEVGCVARIVKLIRMPDGANTAIIQGRRRMRLDTLTQTTPHLAGEVTLLDHTGEHDLRFDALISSVRDMAERIIKLAPNIPNEASTMLDNIDNPSFLLNFIASNLGSTMEGKQEILEVDDLHDKAETILKKMNAELQLLELKDNIENKVRGDIEKQQRDYFLNQQLKTIQEELGEDTNADQLKELEARAKDMQWTKEARQTFDKELRKARRTNPQMAEYSVALSYLELLLDLPWDTYTTDNFDLTKVTKVLDSEHFGLDKVKDRILEHLAVLKLRGDMKAPILCLVGPPGVGKTSLGRSIAKAINRKYVRMSLGGLHDESEIRGHRRTYIGAMPGRIIQSLKKVEYSNPVFILDEIDKVGSNFRGDPSSALLEVLDPEQNSTFYDNYLELEYDLSKVLFIATANSLNTIQPALRDRMEIIRVSGYSQEEKIEIATRHLIPESRKEHGLTGNQVRIGKKLLRAVIENYTSEAGVRSLKRYIDALMRYVAKQVAMEQDYDKSIKPAHLSDILGPVIFDDNLYEEVPTPGVSVGLAWTEVGGKILFIETSISDGKGGLTLTGNLGDVMKESATTALSWLRAHADLLDLTADDFKDRNIHLHVPEGAIPKDGPSAGIAMLSALASSLTGRPVKAHLAMTGEITLRGKVLPVGGIKEKILAAGRAGIKEIMLCESNRRHVEEVPQDYLKGLSFRYVKRMKDVLKHALG